MKIDNRIIGENEPCFIIAEAGVNHNGNFNLAKRLISTAKKVGADAIKFQTFSADREILKFTPKIEYQKIKTEDKETMYEMVKKLEFTMDQFKKLKEYCMDEGIIFLSTPSEEGSAELLEKINVSAYKIGSNDLVTFPMLEQIANYKKPMILSTGGATLEEIKGAIEYTKGCEIALLQCTSSYPAEIKDLNLKIITTLRKEFPKFLVGFSDHSTELFPSVVAICLGAKIIEKHFTLDKQFLGPDHKASLDPKEFKKMVELIRKTEGKLKGILDNDEVINFVTDNLGNKKIKDLIKKSLGSSIKQPTELEKKIIGLIRKCIVAKVALKKGYVINKNVVTFKRPAIAGILPENINRLIGRSVKRNLEKDEPITFDVIN